MLSDQKISTGKLVFGGLTAVVAWFALILQFVFHQGTVGNFFSYFTVLCNLLIAVVLTCHLFLPSSGKAAKFCSSVSVQTAIALYIFIVGLVYNLVLRGIRIPTGWDWIADNLLHVVVPVLYILYWIFFVPKGMLQWKDGIYWIGFPFVYLVYSLIRGPIVNWYPYPFLNLATLGYTRVFLNIGLMLIIFLVAGMILIAVNRRVNKR